MKAMQNREEIGAAAVPYLRVVGHLVFAYGFARMAKVAQAKLAQGTLEKVFLPGQTADRTFLLRPALPRNRCGHSHGTQRRQVPDGGRGCVRINPPAPRLSPASSCTPTKDPDMTPRFPIRQVAVLGAGVMGAQIAAQCINARVPVILFDLPAKEGPKSAIADKAVANLKKLNPAPFGLVDDAVQIRSANYETDLSLLASCDLVIEAIAERMDWKHDLYKKVTPHLAPTALFASNTSGLSITALSEGFDAGLRARFCGVHFFNPPRYMPLVELIPTPTTAPEVLDQLETFLTTHPGQERGARAGYAQLRRQPRRRVFHPRGDARGRTIRPEL
jgi:3-hydroxyacyl-CoA dehydrogenase (EC 1.1.1.35)